MLFLSFANSNWKQTFHFNIRIHKFNADCSRCRNIPISVELIFFVYSIFTDPKRPNLANNDVLTTKLTRQHIGVYLSKCIAVKIITFFFQQQQNKKKIQSSLTRYIHGSLSLFHSAFIQINACWTVCFCCFCCIKKKILYKWPPNRIVFECLFGFYSNSLSLERARARDEKNEQILKEMRIRRNSREQSTNYLNYQFENDVVLKPKNAHTANEMTWKEWDKWN